MTREDLLEAVRRASQRKESDDGTFTVSEAADAWGVSRQTVRNWLRPLRKEGIVEATRSDRMFAGGFIHSTVAYRFVPDESDEMEGKES